MNPMQPAMTVATVTQRVVNFAETPAATGPALSAIARNFLIHLRLRFQILLAPIFLWGFFLADGNVYTPGFWLAFVAFHLCLYGGTTAFNSYYDRDEGPVGGLETPPPVVEALLPLSLALQAIGAVLVLLVNGVVALLYGVIFVLATAYSYPGIRLKARPYGGLVVVALGQGALAALAGWATAQGTLSTLTPLDWTGILAATLITGGFYPLTQIYQVDEDLARGDRTFAAVSGPRRTFVFALVALSVAAVLLIGVLGVRTGWAWAAVVGIFYAALIGAIAGWARTYDSAAVLTNFRRIMRMYTITSGGFLAFLLLQLFLPL